MKKLYIIAAFIVSALIILGSVAPKKGENFELVDDTIFPIVKTLLDRGLLTKPDLVIDKVTVRKVEEPTEQQPYYRYQADVHVKNIGGNIRSATVTLENENDEKPYILRNTGAGFTLEKNQVFVLRDYPLIFDGRLNVGNVNLEVKVPPELELDETNNSYQVTFQEFPAKLTNIRIDKVLDDGTLELSYDIDDFVKRNYGFEVYTSENAVFPAEQMNYMEVDFKEKIFDYYRVDNSNENINNNEWQKNPDTYFNTQYFNVNGKVGKDKNFSLFIKAEDPDSGAYALSDILYFNTSSGINKAELAKLLITLTNTRVYDRGEIYYEDVSREDWFFPYVQTLYNLGVTNLDSTKFYPNQEITRGELLQLAIEFFDVDLVSRSKDGRFKDIPAEHDLYHFAQALYASDGAKYMADYFRPELKASRNFLNFFIRKYAKTY